MENKLICTQQREAFFNIHVRAPSLKRHPVTVTGNYIQVLICGIIIFAKHFWQMQIFFVFFISHIHHRRQHPNHIAHIVKTLVFLFFLWSSDVFQKTLEEKEWKILYMLQNLLSVVKATTIFSPPSCLFWGFRVELERGEKKIKNPAGIFRKKEEEKKTEKTCCIKWTDPIFSLIVSFLKLGRGQGDWGDGGTSIEGDVTLQRTVIWGLTVISPSSCGMAWEQECLPYQPLTLPTGSFLLSCFCHQTLFPLKILSRKINMLRGTLVKWRI